MLAASSMGVSPRVMVPLIGQVSTRRPFVLTNICARATAKIATSPRRECIVQFLVCSHTNWEFSKACIDMTGGEAPQNGSSTLFTLISRCVRLFVGDFWCDFTSGDAPTRYSFSPRLMRKEKGDGFRSRTLLCNSEGGAGQGS